jgi:hypothetical protein
MKQVEVGLIAIAGNVTPDAASDTDRRADNQSEQRGHRGCKRTAHGAHL